VLFSVLFRTAYPDLILDRKKLYRVQAAVRKLKGVSENDNFSNLRAFAELFCQNNPGAAYHILADELQRFVHFFFVMPNADSCLRYGRPFVVTDACHLSIDIQLVLHSLLTLEEKKQR
jgi:hypothetical protein